VIDIGGRRELFVDDFLVDRLMGKAELRLHRPTERKVVFTCDSPWEGNWSGLVTLFKDGDIYRMYYGAGDWPSGKPRRARLTCYAESNDGIHWTRPELGLVEFNGSKKNNIILPDTGLKFVPFKDTNPNYKADEQYKALTYLQKPTRGLYAYASADAIHWRRMRDEPVVTKGYFDSQNVPMWDSVRKRYVEFHRDTRGWDDTRNSGGLQLGITEKGWVRDVLTCTSPDFLNWTEPQWLQYPGSPRMQIYLNQIRPYYRAPHIFVGFLGRFMAGREIEKGLPITTHPAYKYASISETLFMTSRDGVHFKRWGEAFIRPGRRKERWIYGATFPNYGLLVTKPLASGMPDELSLYIYDGGGHSQRGQATRFRRYSLRIDGFVSVNAPLSGGEVVTKPLTFSGSKLAMNFATSAAGSVRLEIQDLSGEPVEGFTLADCPEIFGDQIEQVVTWKSGNNVGQLAGKPVRLRFALKDADLYSIRFQDN